MKYLFLIYIVLVSNFIIAQIPSDKCVDAKRICLNGYTGVNDSFTAGSEPISCPNGQPWGVHNDLWMIFIPKVAKLEISVNEIGNCLAGSGLQALIHEDCNSAPIDCDVLCGGNPIVGSSIEFIPGKVYYLRIDGCSGSICPFQISVSPPNAIEEPNVNLGNWPPIGQIKGDSIFNCLSYSKTLVAPLDVNATIYDWKITKGKGIINQTSNRNIVDLIATDTTDITVELVVSNGCNSSKPTYFNMKYQSSLIISKSIFLCPKETSYFDEKSNQYLYPNDTCGKSNIYNFIITEPIGCKFSSEVIVTKGCDSISSYNLGKLNICKNSFLILNNKFIGVTNKEVSYKIAVEKDNKVNPPICNDSVIFSLYEISPSKQIIKNGDLHCDGDKITLSIGKLNVEKNSKVFFQWEHLVQNNWQAIPNATNSELEVVEAGKYRLLQTFQIQNVVNGLTFTGEYCTMEVYTDWIEIKIENSIQPFDILNKDRICNGNKITLQPIQSDNNLNYFWSINNGNYLNSNSLNLNLTNLANQVCLFATTNCNLTSDTVCKIFIGNDSLKFPPLFSNFTQSCVGDPLLLTINNYDPTLNYSWNYPTDSMNIEVKSNSSAEFIAYVPGVYTISTTADNGCNALTTKNDYLFENQLVRYKIYGPNVVSEKSTQTFCINTGKNNVTWKSSKGLKYKQSYKNGQSCIIVTFPKLTSSGWITATYSNSCSAITDSTFVFVKPFGFTDLAVQQKYPNPSSENLKESNNSTFHILPNPSTGIFKISTAEIFDKIEVTNIIGRNFKAIQINDNQYSISELPSGLYIISLINDGKKLGSRRLMKIE